VACLVIRVSQDTQVLVARKDPEVSLVILVQRDQRVNEVTQADQACLACPERKVQLDLKETLDNLVFLEKREARVLQVCLDLEAGPERRETEDFLDSMDHLDQSDPVDQRETRVSEAYLPM